MRRNSAQRISQNMSALRQCVSVLTAAAGAAVLFLAASVPAYFTAVDRHAVAASGRGTPSAAFSARLALDSAAVSTALILADCAPDAQSVKDAAAELLKQNPSWAAFGGDAPFFSVFLPEAKKAGRFVPAYKYMASSVARKRIFAALGESKSGIVKDLISLRNLNTTLLPPSYSSAGAPFEASLAALAMLAQSGDLTDDFLYGLSEKIDAVGDTRVRESFERCIVGVLALSSHLDYSALGSVFKTFKSPDEVFDFSKAYLAPTDDHFRKCVLAAVLLSGDAAACSRYLENADIKKWGDIAFALDYGRGALEFLLRNNKPVYENSALAEFMDGYSSPLKNLLAGVCAKNPDAALAVKILLSLLGGAVAALGVFGLLRFDRGAYLAARCAVVGVAVSALFFALVEPSAFDVKIQNTASTEINIAFDRIKSNIIGEKDMFSIDTDSATLAAIALFFVMQSAVYIVCLVRINAIKRQRVSASLKLKLLENEDNLFDLGLYIGLAGTVASLILLTFGVITASLMAGYTSTLFGILFTALVKIVHLRKFKRKLLIESANEQHS